MDRHPRNEGSASSARCIVRLPATLGLALVLLLGTGCATEFVSLDPTPEVSESRAKRDLGIDYLSSRRTAMAIRELTLSLELDPADAQTHLWLGEAYRRKGQLDRAENYLRDAIDLALDARDDRTAQEARLNLSALFSQLGRFEDAIEQCSALVADATFSAPWQPLTNCGWAFMKLGRLPEARSHFSDALDFFPRFGPALLNLGILEAREGHRLAAIEMLQKAIASGRLAASGLAEANYRLGEIYVNLGRRQEAVAHFKEAAKVAPHADWGSQSQAYLDLLR